MGHPRRQNQVRRNLDRVVLYYWIGEKLPAHRLDLLAGAGGIGLGEFQLDQLALPHLADPGEPQTGERIADRLALGVENARLELHMNQRLHFRSSTVMTGCHARA